MSGSRQSRRLGRVLAGLLGAALLAAVVIGAFNRPDESLPLGEVRPDAEVPAPLDREGVRQRQEAAGCEVTADGEPLEDRNHVDPADAPPPAALYPDRPPHSGRHFGRLLPLPGGTPEAPVDERAVLHNMEHGSAVVWFDAAGGLRGEVAGWRASRADLGFTSPQGGAVFASPLPADLDTSPAVAFRAWGVAMDCDRFDPVVADAFLIEHWGSHGTAPEAHLAPYPEDSLSFDSPS